LLLSDDRLTQWFSTLGNIGHLKRIRIHSRLPIVLPARITGSLLAAFTASQHQVIVVVHCNHANELGSATRLACRQLKDSGIALLNQSVLLKGVNDNVTALSQLSEQLFAVGIQPYYLHLLDKALGTSHLKSPKTRPVL